MVRVSFLVMGVEVGGAAGAAGRVRVRGVVLRRLVEAGGLGGRGVVEEVGGSAVVRKRIVGVVAARAGRTFD